MKIIASGYMLFGNLRRMYDGHENSKIIFGNDNASIEDIEQEIQNLVTKLRAVPELVGNVGAFLSKVTGLHDNFNITRSDVSEYQGDDEDVISPFR